MITKQAIVDRILSGHGGAGGETGEAFAPANIALCKYWGKRDETLNLPVTSSLSLSLGTLGSHCRLRRSDGPDRILLNDEPLPPEHPFVVRASAFLDLFREAPGAGYAVEATNTIPTAAGFASSASGFASLVLALDQLHGWSLTRREASILARLGSGSACRSLWQGLVEWHAGSAPDGMDSYAEPIESDWDALRIGLLVLEGGPKPLSSRAAMQRTVATSSTYATWPAKVATDMTACKAAIADKDFDRLGRTAESNALAMHATMMTAQPPVLYWKPASVAAMHQVWQARDEGIPVYFTMDAGPNLKLLYLASDQEAVRVYFPALHPCIPRCHD